MTGGMTKTKAMLEAERLASLSKQPHPAELGFLLERRKQAAGETDVGDVLDIVICDRCGTAFAWGFKPQVGYVVESRLSDENCGSVDTGFYTDKDEAFLEFLRLAECCCVEVD